MPHKVRCQPPNKQLQRTVIPNRWRAASAPFHYAHAARWTRGRTAAQLRRYAAKIAMNCRVIALAAALVTASCTTDVASIGDGTYYGYESRSSVSPDEPDAVWFNENVLTVDAGEVRLEKAPRYLLDGKIWASASDGGFRTFDGSIQTLGGRTLVGLRQLACDYCEPPPGDGPLPSKRIREYVVLSNDDGTFELDRVLYSADRNKRPFWLAGAAEQ
jgi:hypothetical protein